MEKKSIRKAMSVMAMMLAAMLALVSCSGSHSESSSELDFNFGSSETFQIHRDADLIFASPMRDSLFAVHGDDLYEYDKNGECTLHEIGHKITQASYWGDFYFIDDEQDLYRLDLQTDKSERLLGKVSDVSAGSYLCGAVTEDGKLYLWGKKAGKYFDKQDNLSVPTEYISDVHWKDAEFGNQHALALDDSGNVYETSTGSDEVTPLKKIDGLKDIETVCCYTYGNLAVEKGGYIHSWSGLFDSQQYSAEKVEKILNDVKPTHYSPGSKFIVAYNDTQAYHWGYAGLSNVNKSTIEHSSPTKIPFFSDYDNIYCGGFVIYLQKGTKIVSYNVDR